jgi:hypothetical protein
MKAAYIEVPRMATASHVVHVIPGLSCCDVVIGLSEASSS